MSTLREQLAKELEQYYASPASIQKVALDALEDAMEGKVDIVDPSSPFMFLLEASATNTSAAILKAESAIRPLYPRLASNYEDLYRHMADEDHLDRFATPSRTTLTLVLPVASVKAQAVEDGSAGVRRLVIPKDTVLKVGDLSWFLHYPIQITVTPTGVIQVNYDLSSYTPLAVNRTNVLDYRTVNTVDGEELVIDIPVDQVGVESYTTPLSPSTGFSATYPLKEQFYYVRAYYRKDGDKWQEMHTTHNSQVFDVDQPTMLVSVLDQAVKVSLPDIYTTMDLVGDQIRVDVFTTQGKTTIDLQDYGSGDFTGRWQDLNNPNDPYITALQGLTDVRVLALEKVISGRNGLSFEALKDRVIYRSADERASITFEELSYQLRDLGYRLSKAKDTITGRLFTCSRPLPPPTEVEVTSTVGVVHGYIEVDTESQDYQEAVFNNGNRTTVTNQALFVEESGSLRLVKDSEKSALEAQPTALRVDRLNQGQHYYTPFFYVLDADSAIYQARPYYLDAPMAINRDHLASNRGVWFSVTTRSVNVQRVGNRYHVTLKADVPTGLTGLHAQVLYRDVAGQEYRLNHDSLSIDGKTATVTFVMETTFDIDMNDRMEVTNLRGVGGGIVRTYVDLVSDFEVLYYKESSVSADTEFDYLIQSTLSTPWVGATHERHRWKLGDSLEGLACRANAIVTPPVFKKHTETVHQTYTETVYERNDEGELVWTIDSVSGKPVFTVAHEAGEVMLDDEGNPIPLHNPGDVMRDSAGMAIQLEGERLAWEFEPLMLDARYYYATSRGVEQYREAIGQTVLAYLERDLRPLEPTLMARTELEYRPEATIGRALARVEGKRAVRMDTALAFNVSYMLTSTGYADGALRGQLIAEAKEVIRSVLYKDTFSMSELTEALSGASEEIVNVSLENPIDGYDVAILQTPNAQFSLRSELYLRSNGTLDIKDAVTVNFTSA